ncbi:uncharacterized protein LOC122367597 isoform X2 [Amphibalanus amphitrite]|uniref:uncharacterized protein LOC122367597 isoform X2 n=1 Tax=Amphibalanus amphitrite TaxID=1232801 RepID=UPI001C929686|nr:uncharacterized protein LOC122367597 isoform X2 [Amphibalanus amphitrite]
MKTVEYLGAVIGNGMVSMSEARVQHLRSLPVPGDVHELRRALGSFAFVQRWIPGVAETARPLYDALDKDGRQKLHWTDKMKSAFNKLKQQVSDAVALYLPDFTKPFTLVTDASDVGTGAMLANRDGQHLKPLGFFHHALSQHEKRVGPNGDLVCSVQAQTLDLESDLTTTIFSPESGCQIQDVFSRYLLLLPAEDSTAETAARLVRTRWISTFGVPVANAATGFSPFELLFARPARRPESAISTGEEPGAARSPTDEVAERRRLLDGMHQKAQLKRTGDGSERRRRPRRRRRLSPAQDRPAPLRTAVARTTTRTRMKRKDQPPFALSARGKHRTV